MCVKHYKRWKKYGDPLFTRPRGYRGTAEERFWAKVDLNGPIPEHRPELGPCRIWTGAQNDGYGVFWVDGHLVGAARFAYELEVDPIPEGHEPDHLCRNPPCVHPAHLEPVTHRENTLRGICPAAQHARSEACPEGHAYDSVRPDGKRRCSRCDKRNGKKRQTAESGPMVACECGCGIQFRQIRGGRVRRYVHGHNMKRAA